MRGVVRILTSALAGASLAVSCDSSSPEGARPDTGGTTPPPTAGPAGTHDWTRFGWNAARTTASPDATGTDSNNVASLRRQQVAIDGTVDASAIYLHGVQ